MAQNITLLGASYSDVPACLLPKTGGGTALFTDVSDTTAAASDVASGKYFYTAAGVKTAGTASGGATTIVDTTDSHGGTIRTITTGNVISGTLQITSNGTYNVSSYASAEVSVSGGSTDRVPVTVHQYSSSYGSYGLVTAYAASNAAYMSRAYVSNYATAQTVYLPPSANGKGLLFLSSFGNSSYYIVCHSSSTGTTCLTQGTSGQTVIVECEPNATVEVYVGYSN